MKRKAGRGDPGPAEGFGRRRLRRGRQRPLTARHGPSASAGLPPALPRSAGSPPGRPRRLCREGAEGAAPAAGAAHRGSRRGCAGRPPLGVRERGRGRREPPRPLAGRRAQGGPVRRRRGGGVCCEEAEKGEWGVPPSSAASQKGHAAAWRGGGPGRQGGSAGPLPQPERSTTPELAQATSTGPSFSVWVPACPKFSKRAHAVPVFSRDPIQQYKLLIYSRNQKAPHLKNKHCAHLFIQLCSISSGVKPSHSARRTEKLHQVKGKGCLTWRPQYRFDTNRANQPRAWHHRHSDSPAAPRLRRTEVPTKAPRPSQCREYLRGRTQFLLL